MCDFEFRMTLFWLFKYTNMGIKYRLITDASPIPNFDYHIAYNQNINVKRQSISVKPPFHSFR